MTFFFLDRTSDGGRSSTWMFLGAGDGVLVLGASRSERVHAERFALEENASDRGQARHAAPSKTLFFLQTVFFWFWFHFLVKFSVPSFCCSHIFSRERKRRMH